ncbi:MAG: HD domain-containing phosphohydrolase [bacterium]
MTAIDQRSHVLCVDDDAPVLQAVARILATRFRVTCTTCAADALAAMQYGDPFAVVVSDLKLPDMDGIALLTQAQTMAPTTVRLLMTGHADLDSVIDAINRGHVFSFLRKPFQAPLLVSQVELAAAQHRLLTSERTLLEDTLHGAVRALSELLSLSCPAAFGRGTRLARHAADLAAALKVPNRWEVEVAAMLSQMGYVILPTAILDRSLRGDELDRSEQAMIDRLPVIEESLLAPIPRLEGVRNILRHQRVRFDGVGSPGGPRSHELPVGSRILKLVADFDQLEYQGRDAMDALEVMMGRHGWYDMDMLNTFAQTSGFMGAGISTMDVRLCDVATNMIFAEDVLTSAGVTLIARGQDVTPALLGRIHSNWEQFARSHWVRMIRSDA